MNGVLCWALGKMSILVLFAHRCCSCLIAGDSGEVSDSHKAIQSRRDQWYKNKHMDDSCFQLLGEHRIQRKASITFPQVCFKYWQIRSTFMLELIVVWCHVCALGTKGNYLWKVQVLGSMSYVYPMGTIRAIQSFVKTNYFKINVDRTMQSFISPWNLSSKCDFF